MKEHRLTQVSKPVSIGAIARFWGIYVVSPLMSKTTVMLSCAAGAATFVAFCIAVHRSTDEEPIDHTLSAKIALFLAASVAFIAVGLTGLFGGSEAGNILLAEVPGRRVREFVYFSYASFTFGVLSISAALWQRVRRRGGGV